MYLQVGAADRDQAAIVLHRLKDLIHYNPWLDDRIAIHQNKVYSRLTRNVVLDVLAADVAGSHGETPDVLIINELSHVTKWEFVENLLDNANKVSSNVVIIATNAGFKGTKAERLKNEAEANPKRWTMQFWKEPAPWVSKEDMQEAKARNTRSRYRRLWWGQWSSGKGDALDEEDIDRCLAHHKGPLASPEKGWVYVAGLDLGITHDHAALTVVGVNSIEQRIRLAWMKAWEPNSKTGQVDLIDVEETVLKMTQHWHLQCVGFDPTEARLMAQRLRRKGVPMKEMSFSSPKNLNLMASALVQVVSGKHIGDKEEEDVPSAMLEAFDDEEGRLRRDFGKLCVVERKPFGYKLEAVSDEYGHADVGIGLAIILPRAIDLLVGRVGLQADDDLADGTEEDLSEEEIEELPDDLKDLYAVADEMEDPHWEKTEGHVPGLSDL